MFAAQSRAPSLVPVGPAVSAPPPTNFSSQPDDDDDDIMGRNTLKLRSQAVVWQYGQQGNPQSSTLPNSSAPPGPYDFQSRSHEVSPSSMAKGSTAASRGGSFDYARQRPGAKSVASAAKPPSQQLKWELTPDLMQQPWGSVLRVLK
eukprot:6200050-Pleurochrysis_carterae.AAC.1